MKMRFLPSSLLLPGLSALLGVSAAAAQTAPQPAEAQAQLTLHDLQEAEALGSDIYANSGATGMVLVVVRGDQVFIHGYGETAPGSQAAPTQDSVIRLCSLTKISTTDVLAKLAADHAVSLDDPLEKYAPQGAAVPEMGAPITLLELATHTSGLEREIGTAPRHTPHFTYPDFATRWQWLPTAELKFTPGTQAFYSNIGFDLLSDALASAAHESYATLLWSRTLAPLKMWETTYYPSASQCARLMQSAHHDGPCTVTENTEGSSGLYSTAGDMAKWLRYLVGSGTAASPAQADAAHAVYLLPSSLTSVYGLEHAGRPAGIGLGWMHLGANDDISHIIEKTGGGAGFTTYIAIHPASHTALFVAATDGAPRAARAVSAASGSSGPVFGLFHESNNALLALAGLPPRPAEPSMRRMRARRMARAAAPAARQVKGTPGRGQARRRASAARGAANSTAVLAP
jgi:serine-type D-Ala-D-Ala carboxypeptidase/endopeptidase